MAKFVYVSLDGSDIVVKSDKEIVSITSVGKVNDLVKALKHASIGTDDDIYLSSDFDFDEAAADTVNSAFSSL